LSAVVPRTPYHHQSTLPVPGSNQPIVTPSRAGRILEAGITAFAATTGAILAFGHSRGGALLPFTTVGRRVVREVTLPIVGDATVGLIVHFGQCLALGALVVLLAPSGDRRSRVRAALLTVLLWHLAAMVSWFSAIRADSSLSISTFARAGFALVLVLALVVGSRDRNDTKDFRMSPPD
jgi:hypothetical protein